MPARGLQHVVLMRFPEPLDAGRRRLAARAWSTGWPDEIGGLPGVPGRRRTSPARAARAGTTCCTRRSPTTTTLQAYIDHPVHQEFVAFLNDRECERLAFDYYF